MHLPSAGMIRFRFDGFAFASQPFAGHPEVLPKIGELTAGARGLLQSAALAYAQAAKRRLR